MTKIIETHHLSKHFGPVRAVDDVSLHVEKGEIYGFLGLNGAGKTTMIRMLLGLIAPTRGEITIMGQGIVRGGHGPWEDIGCLVETPYSYPELTVTENLEIYKRLRGITDVKAVDKVISKLKLDPYKHRKAGHLSLGNSQRLGLAKALIHNPAILFLDEPSNSLDPSGIVEIRELLLDLANNQNVTIFISSHNLGEISRLAGRIGIIHQGALVQEVKSTDLEGLLKKRLLVNTRDNQRAMRVLTEQGYKPVLNSQGCLELTDPKSISAPETINAMLTSQSVPPFMLYPDIEDLEAYFLRTIGAEGGVQ